jgi:hypothetical protein
MFEGPEDFAAQAEAGRRRVGLLKQAAKQGCQIVYLNATKNTIRGHFTRGPWKRKCRNILWSFEVCPYLGLFSIIYGHLVYLWLFGIFYGHLVYFVAIWNILRPFGIFYGHLVYLLAIWNI